MGFKKYHGPVTTVEEAMFGNLPVNIACQRCRHQRMMHAYRLVRLGSEARRTFLLSVKLGEPVRGFKCEMCRRPVEVIITAPVPWV